MLGTLALAVSGTVTAQPAVQAQAPSVGAEPIEPNAWRYTAGVKQTGIRFKSSVSRKSASETGLIFDADNAQAGGVSGGFGRSNVNYSNGTPKLNQTNYNLSGRMYSRDAITGGKTIYRLDHLRADNNDATRLTDNVRAWAPKIGLVTDKGNLFVDLEYAQSRYEAGLKVRQFVPTIGFAMNDQYDWFSFRPYMIRINDATRAMGKRSTSALDATWTHYNPPSNSPWVPANYSVGAVLGTRIYAVNTETGSISNLAHLNKGGVNFGVNWRLVRDVNLGLYAGSSKNSEPNGVGITQNYSAVYGNLTLTATF